MRRSPGAACTGVIALAGGLFGWLIGFATAWPRR